IPDRIKTLHTQKREADGAVRRSRAPWTHPGESATEPVPARAAARCKAPTRTRADPRIVDEDRARYAHGSPRPRLRTPQPVTVPHMGRPARLCATDPGLVFGAGRTRGLTRVY